MTVLCAAGKGEMEIGACLDCALTSGDPPCGYDYVLLKSILGDGEQEKRRGEIHVTDLTGCIRKAYYDKRDPSPEFVHDKLVRWLGTYVHAGAEGSDFFVESELPMAWDGITGRADIVYKNGRLVDIKCQPAGELVTMADGTEKKIEDVQIFDKVLSWDGERLHPASVTAIMDGGIQDIYEVRLASGQRFRAGGTHPVLTDRGFVPVKDLRKGEDRAVVVSRWTGDVFIPPEDARLIGYLIGDGGTSRQYGIRFTNNSPEILEDLRSIVEARGWTLTKVNKLYDYRIGMYGKKLSTVGPMAFIQKYGIHRKLAHEKDVPCEVLSGDVSTIVNFLAAYFDTDGTISEPESVDRMPCRLSMTTTSKVLARQVSELLRRLNIANRIHDFPVGYNGKVTRTGYTICVWQSSEIVKFGTTIPFRCQKKRDRFERWLPMLKLKLRKGGKNLRRIEDITFVERNRAIGLEIEGTHTYVTNGVITHNTTRWLKIHSVPYGSHALQVNVYAWMLRKMGREINKLQIQYIDLSGPSKCRGCKRTVQMIGGMLKCPECLRVLPDAHLGALLVEIPILTDEEVEAHILDRKKELEASIALGDPPTKEPGFLCAYCAHTEKCQPGNYD